MEFVELPETLFKIGHAEQRFIRNASVFKKRYQNLQLLIKLKKLPKRHSIVKAAVISVFSRVQNNYLNH